MLGTFSPSQRPFFQHSCAGHYQANHADSPGFALIVLFVENLVRAFSCKSSFHPKIVQCLFLVKLQLGAGQVSVTIPFGMVFFSFPLGRGWRKIPCLFLPICHFASFSSTLRCNTRWRKIGTDSRLTTQHRLNTIIIEEP